jgi:hypothetical protein
VKDPVHYNHKGTDVRKLSVLAFQKLWNRNNPNAKIGEDSLYGAGTEAALLKSPANGWH